MKRRSPDNVKSPTTAAQPQGDLSARLRPVGYETVVAKRLQELGIRPSETDLKTLSSSYEVILEWAGLVAGAPNLNDEPLSAAP